MKKISVFILFFCLHISAGICQNKEYWQQQVNYSIEVTLNDSANTLDGFERMEYFNNSPDTLSFIWIHLWPNAYKNDKTAFSEQFLENGRTDFYFSDEEKRGYINNLNFKVNNAIVRAEDHPLHQDIIKIVLPSPLLPKTNCKIETRFHVKLPYNFSRGGHEGQSYQITQWYPKPAVYDKKGWHEIPYLDQGEFYSEFGHYDVKITLPQNYIVAATGELQNEDEIKWLNNIAVTDQNISVIKIDKNVSIKGKSEIIFPTSSERMKTISYKQDNIHDFAWFADKRFIVKHDTLQLVSGKTIDEYAYFLPESYSNWKNSLAFIKNTILTRSRWLGEYPYRVVSVVEARMGFNGGMEYPTITSISPVKSERELESTIEHEVGHNWNYGILASNERTHPWMDEGINSFYDNRYAESDYISKNAANKKSFFASRMPENQDSFLLQNIINVKKDQPIETISEKFSEYNYGVIAYYKTSKWMKLLENDLGRALFDSCMHEFYNRWKFRHPYPEDIKQVFDEVSGKNMDSVFALKDKKGYLALPLKKHGFEIKTFFDLNNQMNKNQIFISPSVGYNFYDKLMVGVLIHNYTLPQNKFQFFVSPLYGTNSKQLNGIGNASYHWFPGNKGEKVEIMLSGASFSENSFTDSINHTEYFRFSKVVPSLKFVFANKSARSSIIKFIQWKTFFISQKQLQFTRDTVNMADVITYPSKKTYINQLRFVVQNKRVLYPYNGEIIAEQGKEFVRTSITLNYYFNYAKGGGMNVRFFAGKFFYLGDKTYLKEYNTDAYQLNMTGPKGYEDYTYSNYFIGRNEFDNFPSQQIMIRDGGFKVRTDLLSSKIGKTDNWLMAANFTSDIPKSINPLQMLPVKIPLKAFVDVGTYADAWGKNPTTGRFIYDAGLQLSLLKNIVNIYVPLIYSKEYNDYFKSTIPTKRFWKTISFSLDIQNLPSKKTIAQTLF